MKLFHVIVCAFGLVANFGWADDTNMPAMYEPAVGRYQLTSAPVLIVDGRGRYQTETRLFRLDTVTGKVWTHTSNPWPMTVGTNIVILSIESWEPIAENFSQTASNYSAVSRPKPNPVLQSQNSIYLPK